MCGRSDSKTCSGRKKSRKRSSAVGERELSTILNKVVREDFTGKVSLFELKPKGSWEANCVINWVCPSRGRGPEAGSHHAWWVLGMSGQCCCWRGSCVCIWGGGSGGVGGGRGRKKKLRWDHTWIVNTDRSLAFCLGETWHRWNT